MATSRSLNDIAGALVQTAHEAGTVPVIVNDLKTMSDVFSQRDGIRASLSAPSLSADERRAALTNALEGMIHPFVRNAIFALMEQELLDELSAFTEIVLEKARTIASHFDAKVTSPIPLTREERETLGKAIEQKFGGTHTLSEHVDPHLLGGIVLDVGDWHVDASVKGKLNRLMNALTA